MTGYLRKSGVLLCLMLVASEGYAGMFGLGKRVDVFLCPEVRGKITMNGAPLSGVRLMRELYYDNEILHRTESLESGTFSFDQLTIKSRTPNRAFSEARTHQIVVADYEGERYLLWYHVTDSIKEEPLISEKLRNLNCDLSDDEIFHHFPIPGRPDFTYNVKSICRW